ncbi:phage protein GemA/Gp16 family protein [Sulfurimonas sp.]|uniref:phage protein GemA/Gp16 family protein n=1 Tax=Sulfurimonas sp. TaxID=2022749 RepID=UPI0025D12418|nr:phage protein GemA/Gp16 family protein [Sulfurimonas sp.]
MTQKQTALKKMLVRQIHINSKNVFNEKEERLLFMESRFGKSSTLDMSIDELKLLLQFCERKVSDIAVINKTEVGVEFITAAQKEKIRVLWKLKARDKSENALLSFASKITKRDVKRLDDILKGKGTKLIIALNKLTN